MIKRAAKEAMDRKDFVALAEVLSLPGAVAGSSGAAVAGVHTDDQEVVIGMSALAEAQRASVQDRVTMVYVQMALRSPEEAASALQTAHDLLKASCRRKDPAVVATSLSCFRALAFVRGSGPRHAATGNISQGSGWAWLTSLRVVPGTAHRQLQVRRQLGSGTQRERQRWKAELCIPSQRGSVAGEAAFGGRALHSLAAGVRRWRA
jgi:hypothetical protein